MENKTFKPRDIKEVEELFRHEMTDVVLNLRGEFAAVSGESFENFTYDKEIPQVKAVSIPPVETKTLTVDIDVDTAVDVAKVAPINFEPQKNTLLKDLCDKTKLNNLQTEKTECNIQVDYSFNSAIPALSNFDKLSDIFADKEIAVQQDVNSKKISELLSKKAVPDAEINKVEVKPADISRPSTQHRFEQKINKKISVAKAQIKSDCFDSKINLGSDFKIEDIELSSDAKINIPETKIKNCNVVFEKNKTEKKHIDVPFVPEIKEKYSFETDKVTLGITFRPIREFNFEHNDYHINIGSQLQPKISVETDFNVNVEETVRYILNAE